MVLVDTSIWSLALRRRSTPASADSIRLNDLIDEMRVVMIGPIRQELLSGIRDSAQYIKLRGYLRAFPDFKIEADDYERAADCCNTCRRQGIQGSSVDFLICSVAKHHGLPIFTVDKDFKYYAKFLGIKLF